MPELGESLSGRELDVLRLIASGASNKDVAADLVISQNTVKVHLRNIYTKLGVTSRTEAAAVALQRGLISIPQGTQGDVGQPVPQYESTASETSAEATQTAHSDKDELPLPRWLLALLVIIALTIVAGVGYFIYQQLGPAEEVAAEPFEVTPLEDSRWVVGRPMDAGRSGMASAAIGLDLYLIGGESAEGVSGDVDIYDTSHHAWRQASEKPTPVTNASADELFGEIYVPGGILADGSVTDVVEAYSPTQNAWRTIASLPQPIAGGLVISEGGYLYLIGGRDGDEYLDNVYEYDPAADSWRPLTSIAGARSDAAGGSLTGRLFVVGGHDENEDLADCQVFDAETESWTSCPDLLQPRSNAGSTVMLNRLYIIGGVNSDDGVEFSEVFNPDTEQWSVVNTPMLSDIENWSQPGVASIETRVYALGGSQNGIIRPDNHIFSPLVFRTYIPAAGSAD